jgi:hypothetical protein
MADGIRRLIDLFAENQFTFVVNGQEHPVRLVEAVLLSPHVASQFKMDNTTQRFVVDDDRLQKDSFSLLVSLIRSERVRITSSSRKSLILLCHKLGNRSLEIFIVGLPFGPLWNEIVVEGGSPAELKTEIDLCSISSEDLSFLDLETLESILSSDNLRIESEDWLLNLILSLGDDYLILLKQIKIEMLSDEGLLLFFDQIEYCDITCEIWNGLVRRFKGIEDNELRLRRFLRKEIDSLIISSIPNIFSVFGKTSYQLLYRGSRDGFRSGPFHQRVDGHSHTVTIVETTKGFVFGGYMVCQWDSSNSWKSDESMRSFLFTLKNPHNLAPRIFSLCQKEYSMLCYRTGYLVWFGNAGCIGIPDDCNENNNSHTNGYSLEKPTYANDTGLPGSTLFTGEKNFTVKELEIFEVSV